MIALAALPEGRLASGALDGSIKIWNFGRRRKCERTLRWHGAPISELTLLTPRILASTAQDHHVLFWDWQDGTCLGGSGQLEHWPRRLRALGDGRFALSQGDSIEVRRIEDGKCEMRLQGAASAMVLLPHGRLAAAESNNNIAVWNIATGERELTLRGHSSDVTSLVVRSDGTLASGSDDGTVRIWDVSRPADAHVYEQHHRFIRKLALLPDGRISSWTCDGIKLWDPATGECVASLPGHPNETSSTCVMRGRLSCCGAAPRIAVWNLSRGICEKTIDIHRDEIPAVAEMPDGRFAFGAADGSVTIYNHEADESVALDEKHVCAVDALAALSTGHLLSEDQEGTVKVWNLARGVCEITLYKEGVDLTACALLPDGQFASGILEESTIKLWHLVTGKCTATLSVSGTLVTALAVLPDGRLFSGSMDHIIRCWTQRSEGRWSSTVQFVADMPIVALAVAPKSSVLVAGDISGRLHFLEYANAG